MGNAPSLGCHLAAEAGDQASDGGTQRDNDNVRAVMGAARGRRTDASIAIKHQLFNTIAEFESDPEVTARGVRGVQGVTGVGVSCQPVEVTAPLHGPVKDRRNRSYIIPSLERRDLTCPRWVSRYGGERLCQRLFGLVGGVLRVAEEVPNLVEVRGE